MELNVNKDPYDPLFAFGYGLGYGDNGNVAELSEDSGLSDGAPVNKGVFFSKGEFPAPWELIRYGSPVSALPFESAGLIVSAYDRAAQEDSLKIVFKTGEENFEIASSYAIDLSRESNGAMELSFHAKSIEGSGNVRIGMGCEWGECDRFIPVTLTSEWSETRLSLSCFSDLGTDMATLKKAFIVDADAGQSIAIADVQLAEDEDAAANCE